MVGKTEIPADLGAHERPWWLRTHEARAARTLAASAASAAFLAESSGSQRPEASSSSSSSARPGRRSREEVVEKTRREVAPAAPARPLSPSTHLQELKKTAQKHLKVVPCDQYHRHYWATPSPAAQQEDMHEATRPSMRHDGFGTKEKVWGKRPTDYRTAGWYVENMWGMRALQ
ncbi:unnamed protein product, partial [Polarella glacialis]